MRPLLCDFIAYAPAMDKAIAVIASTPDRNVSVGDLPAVPSMLFAKCLSILVDMFSVMFGVRTGIAPIAAVAAITEKWTDVDELFALVTSKYREDGHASAYGFFRVTTQIRIVKWFACFWKFLKADAVGPLVATISTDTLARDDGPCGRVTA